jgi:alkylation response protein AidB-like acyl-CoA dehydrogenase
VNLDLSDEQAAVDALFRSFFHRECPPATVRAAEGLGFDPGLWARLRDTGAPAIAIPETSGGGGGGLFDATLLTEAAGAHLAPVPIVEHVVAARLLCAVGATAALAQALDAGRPVSLALRPAEDTAVLVPAGAVAASVIVRSADHLVLCHGEPPMVAAPNGAGLPVADRCLDPSTVLGDASTLPAYEHAVAEWRLLMAAALIGVAEAALAIGVDYVRERHQFGVPIGSFQAIQHGLAELPGQISGARLLAPRGAWRGDQGDEPGFCRDASMAFVFATELARTVTSRVVHYQGGYGVMQEYDAQLYYRRARGWPAQLGDPDGEVDQLADLLYGPARPR